MITSRYRGHAIEYVDGEWVYSDTGDSTADTHEDRGCGYCNLSATKEGHDGCLGTLKGVMNACCGHGDNAEAYVQFLDKTSVRGEDAIDIMAILRRWSE